MKRFLFFLSLIFIQQSLSARLPDLIPFRKGPLWGYSDSTRKIIIPCKFTYAAFFQNPDSARGVFENANGWIMENGDFHKDPPSNNFVTYTWSIPTGGLFNPISWAVFTNSNVIQPKLRPFQDSLTLLYGYENANHKIIIPAIYSEEGYFHEGLASVMVDEYEMDYINEKGKSVLKFPGYSQLGNDFKNGVAIVSASSGMGMIDKKGKFIIPPVCYQIIDEGNFYVETSGEDDNIENAILFDSKGKMIDSRIFPSFTNGNYGLFWASDNNQRFAFFNDYGKQVTPFQYNEVRDFSEGIVAVMDTNSLWGFMNEEAKRITPCKYVEISLLNGGFASYRDSTLLWGFLNDKAQEAIPCQYEEAMDFSNGFAAVRLDSKFWGFINEKGTLVVPCKYALPQHGFDSNGFCEVANKNFIDFHGTEYWED